MPSVFDSGPDIIGLSQGTVFGFMRFMYFDTTLH